MPSGVEASYKMIRFYDEFSRDEKNNQFLLSVSFLFRLSALDLLIMNDFLDVTIRYLIDGSAFSWDFWLVLFVGAAFSALFIYRGRDLKRCIVIPLLLAYITMMLNLTILSREPHIAYRFNFQPFWYLESSSKTALYYVILNYIFFVPLGLMLEALQKKRRVWMTVLISFSFSVFIEATQLFLKLGLAEFDDIFENTIGALLGALIYQGVAVLVRKIRAASPRLHINQ